MRNDPERLARLRQCLVLDSAPERVYDDLARLLADGLGAPITMINLLDAQRDWFKSVVGLPLQESPAETSFCDSFFHTSDDLIVVTDTTRNSQYANHPLVVNAPHIRFYAAARLVVQGQTLGTLCAYDLKPRQITADQVAQLQTLAAAAVELLSRRAINGAG